MSAAFLFAELRATLRERRTHVCAALMLYAVLAVPPLLARPPAHVTDAVAHWFHTRDPFALCLYVWTDLAMNKLLPVLGVALAGGLVLRERDTHSLPLLLAKPVRREAYFVVRVLAACGAMAAIYLGGHLVAALWFARSVAGFRPGLFAASMVVHLGAALFAVTLSATLTLWVRRRSAGALASLLVLMTLVGAAFAGSYNPAWEPVARCNPFAQGASVLAHLHDLRPAHVLVPVATLLAVNAATVALGALGMRRIEP